MPYAHSIEQSGTWQDALHQITAKTFWTGCIAGTYKIIIGSAVRSKQGPTYEIVSCVVARFERVLHCVHCPNATGECRGMEFSP